MQEQLQVFRPGVTLHLRACSQHLYHPQNQTPKALGERSYKSRNLRKKSNASGKKTLNENSKSSLNGKTQSLNSNNSKSLNAPRSSSQSFTSWDTIERRSALKEQIYSAGKRPSTASMMNSYPEQYPITLSVLNPTTSIPTKNTTG